MDGWQAVGRVVRDAARLPREPTGTVAQGRDGDLRSNDGGVIEKVKGAIR